MGIFTRGLVGAAIGGAMGWNDGNRGRLGGAGMGALAGMAGPALGRKLYGMNNMVGRGLRKAGGYAGQGMGWAGGKLSSLGSGLLANKSLMAKDNFSRRAFGYASGAAVDIGGAIKTNKYGSTALLGLGMGAASYIGSTALRSNGR